LTASLLDRSYEASWSFISRNQWSVIGNRKIAGREHRAWNINALSGTKIEVVISHLITDFISDSAMGIDNESDQVS